MFFPAIKGVEDGGVEVLEELIATNLDRAGNDRVLLNPDYSPKLK